MLVAPSFPFHWVQLQELAPGAWGLYRSGIRYIFAYITLTKFR